VSAREFKVALVGCGRIARSHFEALAGLELESGRFAERWSLLLGSPVESNLVAADLSARQLDFELTT